MKADIASLLSHSFGIITTTMKKHFIFDFDDTISGSYEFNQNMFYETFLPHFPDIREEFVRKVHKENRGKSMDRQFQLVIDKFNLNIGAQKLTEENEALHVKNYKGMKLFNGIHEFFSILKDKGKKISVCTNRQYTSLNKIIDSNDLRKYFENIISCKDEGYEKPKPNCLLSIIKKYNEPKDSYIYFGDSKTDYEFASNAGLDFVIVDHYINGKNFYKMIIKSFL